MELRSLLPIAFFILIGLTMGWLFKDVFDRAEPRTEIHYHYYGEVVAGDKIDLNAETAYGVSGTSYKRGKRDGH